MCYTKICGVTLRNTCDHIEPEKVFVCMDTGTGI